MVGVDELSAIRAERSFVYMLNRTYSRTDPRGSPLVCLLQELELL